VSGGCKHERCEATVSVETIAEYAERNPEHRIAEVTVRCVVCGARSRWLGVSGGIAPDDPRTDPFGETIRAPFAFEPPTLPGGGS
jgi:hypothetical protein